MNLSWLLTGCYVVPSRPCQYQQLVPRVAPRRHWVTKQKFTDSCQWLPIQALVVFKLLWLLKSCCWCLANVIVSYTLIHHFIVLCGASDDGGGMNVLSVSIPSGWISKLFYWHHNLHLLWVRDLDSETVVLLVPVPHWLPLGCYKESWCQGVVSLPVSILSPCRSLSELRLASKNSLNRSWLNFEG
jgi:hypothetical protein